MKKIFLIFLAAFSLVTLPAMAQDAPKTVVTDTMRAQMAETATAALNRQGWTIYLTPAVAAAKKAAVAETDVLTFKEGTVESKNLLIAGYHASNYTLRLQDDGVAIWETMQVNAEGDHAFLRGELNGSVMNGLLTTKSKKGIKKAYYFSTVMPESSREN